MIKIELRQELVKYVKRMLNDQGEVLNLRRKNINSILDGSGYTCEDFENLLLENMPFRRRVEMWLWIGEGS